MSGPPAGVQHLLHLHYHVTGQTKGRYSNLPYTVTTHSHTDHWSRVGVNQLKQRGLTCTHIHTAPYTWERNTQWYHYYWLPCHGCCHSYSTATNYLFTSNPTAAISTMTKNHYRQFCYNYNHHHDSIITNTSTILFTTMTTTAITILLLELLLIMTVMYHNKRCNKAYTVLLSLI